MYVHKHTNVAFALRKFSTTRQRLQKSTFYALFSPFLLFHAHFYIPPLRLRIFRGFLTCISCSKKNFHNSHVTAHNLKVAQLFFVLLEKASKFGKFA